MSFYDRIADRADGSPLVLLPVAAVFGLGLLALIIAVSGAGWSYLVIAAVALLLTGPVVLRWVQRRTSNDRGPR